MANHLYNLIKKELLEIFRDPRLFLGMIIVPVLIFPLMGGAMRVSMEATTKEMEKMNVGLINLDIKDGNGNYSEIFYNLMIGNKLVVTNISTTSVDEGLKWCGDHGIKTLVVLPSNFTEQIILGKSADVGVYQILKRFDMGEAAGAQRVVQTINLFNSLVIASELQVQYPGSTPSDLLTPANARSQSVINGKVKDQSPDAVITTLITSSIMMPIMIMLLIIMTGQLAATSVAMEKEQKTLEVLLTLPIKRIYILLGKITGVVVVSLIATIAYIAGFSYYMSSMSFGTASQSVDLSTMGLTPDPMGFALLGISLFLAFLAALSIAVMIAAYTKDVRSAQSLIGILYIPIMIPAFILMFTSVEILPVYMQGVLYAIPFTYPTLAAKAVYTHDYLIIILGIIYQLIFTTIVLGIAARFYNSERVLTAKLVFGKGKKKQVVE